MQREVLFDDFRLYCDELRRLSIKKVISAEINEYRSIQVEPNKLQVVNFIQIELLAYKDSVLYKFVSREDPSGYIEKLEKKGFTVTRKSRNIT